MDEADRLFNHGRGNPAKFGWPIRSSAGAPTDDQRLEDAARLLGRPVFFVDEEGYEREIIGAAVKATGDIAYVESRSKESQQGHVDITIRIHLITKSGWNESADIESYNPYFGCDVLFFEWIDAAAVLVYREKHWTFSCRFGDVWPPRFVKIEDDWVIDGRILSYLGYRQPVVHRLSFPSLERIDPIPVADAFATDLFPESVKEQHNQALQRVKDQGNRSWFQRLFGLGPGR